MIEVRVDALSGAVVAVAAERQDRPERPAGCPFCPGGLEAPQQYDVHAFPNRWPSLPDGRAEVLLFSPDHDASLGTLGRAGIRRVVDLWSDRTAALGSRDDVSYVLLFENRGALVGATIDHPHGQLFAFDFVPEVPRRELDHDACVLCGVDRDGRTVSSEQGWWAAVPYAPTWPFELLVASDHHVTDLPSTTSDDRDALASVLDDALARLDRLFDAPMPYMLWIHQQPTDGGTWPAAHLKVQIAPAYRRLGTQRFVAAGELGSGVSFDPVVPEHAAARLRELPGPLPAS